MAMSVKSPSLSDAHHSRAIISGFPKAMERAGRLIGFRDAVRQAPAGDVQMCQIGSRRFWADSNGGRLTPDNFGQPRQITTTVEGRDAIPKHPRRPATQYLRYEDPPNQHPVLPRRWRFRFA